MKKAEAIAKPVLVEGDLERERERVQALLDEIERIRAIERERCAKLVPTNWCDVLLTGPDAARPPLGERGIEALLRGIQDRIRTST
jgi:hypothetical protein